MTNPQFRAIFDRKIQEIRYEPGKRIAIPKHLHPVWWGMTSGQLAAEVSNGTHSVIKIAGPLDRSRLQEACNAVARSHPILLCGMIRGDGLLEFEMSPDLEVPINFQTSGGDGQSDIPPELSDLVWDTFDFDRERLWRVFCLSVSPEEHYVGFVIHHFVADAESVEIVERSIIRAYELGDEAASPEPECAFLAYSQALDEWANSPMSEASIDYWRNLLQGAPDTTLPRAELTGQGGTASRQAISFEIDGRFRNLWRAIARRAHVTTFLLVLAANLKAHSKITGQSDLSTLVVSSRRDSEALFSTVGAFANIIPIRLTIREEDDVSSIARDLQKHFAASSPHAIVPDTMLRPATDSVAMMPMFNYLELEASSRAENLELLSKNTSISTLRIALPDWRRKPLKVVERHSHILEVVESASTTLGVVRFSPEICSRETVEEFIAELRDVLHNCR